MSLLVIYIFFSVSISFACSLMESVILSVSPAYMMIAAKKGRRSGQILQELKSQIDRPLAAILTANTVANTVGAAAVGAEIHSLYGNEFVAVGSVLLTLVILIFSEIIPKTMGTMYWKTLAPMCSYTIRALIIVTYPFVLLSEGLRGLLGRRPAHRMTREEMIMTAEMGANEGTLHPKESHVIRNLLMLDKVKVSDIMTPRSVIFAFEEGKTVGEVMSEHLPLRFSRIPIYNENLDNIIGMTHRYKLMEAASHDHDSVTIEKLMSPIHTIPEGVSVAAALDQFIKRREHIFLVVDDYGTTSGLVSLEDAVETLLGVEIVDELDSVTDMRQYARELWRDRKQQKAWPVK